MLEATFDSIDALGSTAKDLETYFTKDLVGCLDFASVIFVVQTSFS